MFDSEIDIKKSKIECVYTNNETEIFENNKCQSCDYELFIGEDNFMTCSNTNCGIIYKDNLDRTRNGDFMVVKIIKIVILQMWNAY